MTKELRRQYECARGPLGAEALQEIGRLEDEDVRKLVQFGSSASRVDRHHAEVRDLPKEDRFLAEVASACRARWLVVNDHSIPRRTLSIPARGGGRVEIEFVDHEYLISLLAR